MEWEVVIVLLRNTSIAIGLFLFCLSYIWMNLGTNKFKRVWRQFWSSMFPWVILLGWGIISTWQLSEIFTGSVS